LVNYEFTGYLSIVLILFSIFMAAMLNKKMREREVDNQAILNKEALAGVD
jgi:hypothetical protein